MSIVSSVLTVLLPRRRDFEIEWSDHVRHPTADEQIAEILQTLRHQSDRPIAPGAGK
jgi:hypothetical protein